MENTQKFNYSAVDLGLEQMYSKVKMFTVHQCVRWAHIRDNEENVYVTHKTQRRDKSVPSRITFCFEPSAFTGPASPSRSVPLKP